MAKLFKPCWQGIAIWSSSEVSPPPRKLLQVCGERLRPSHGQSQLQYHIWHHLILDEDVWFLPPFVPQPLHRGWPRNNSLKKLNLFCGPQERIPQKELFYTTVE